MPDGYGELKTRSHFDLDVAHESHTLFYSPLLCESGYRSNSDRSLIKQAVCFCDREWSPLCSQSHLQNDCGRRCHVCWENKTQMKTQWMTDEPIKRPTKPPFAGRPRLACVAVSSLQWVGLCTHTLVDLSIVVPFQLVFVLIKTTNLQAWVKTNTNHMEVVI